MTEPMYRHKKRGGLYAVHGRATLQVDGPHDMAECVIYSSTADGRVWVRPAAEFFDGRFEAVQNNKPDTHHCDWCGKKELGGPCLHDDPCPAWENYKEAETEKAARS